MPDMSTMPSRGFSIGVSEVEVREAAGHGNKKILKRTVLPVPTNSAAPSKPGKVEPGPPGLGDRHDRVQNVNDTFSLAGTGDLKIDVNARA